MIPAPFVSINKSYQRAGDDRKVGTLYSLSLKGKIIPYKGSPIVPSGISNDVSFDDLGTFHYPDDGSMTINDRQDAIRVKQEAIRSLFSVEGKWLEISPWNGQPPSKAQVRIKDINFADGQWVETCDYTINMEADQLICGIPDLAPYEDAASGDSISADRFTGMDIVKDYHVKSVNETWSIDFDTEIYGLFKVQHSVNAVGKRTFDMGEDPLNINKEAWENAKDWVKDRLGYNPLYAMSGSIKIPSGSYNAYNHIRTENVNYFNGEYSVNETWVLGTGNYYESFTIESRRNITDGLTQVNIQGNIVGLDANVIGTGNFPLHSYKYENASGAWDIIKPDIYLRAKTYTDINLNLVPLSEVIGRNPNTGTLTYSYEYNNRPSMILSGVLSENISIDDDNISGDIEEIASILVLGRTEGPVLQSLQTTRSKKRSVSIEAVVEITGGLNFTPPSFIESGVNYILTSVAPASSVKYITQSKNNWSPTSGRFSKIYEWTYE